MILFEPQNLFIDTSVFVKENFLEGARIKNILELSKQGYFNFIFHQLRLMKSKLDIKNL